MNTEKCRNCNILFVPSSSGENVCHACLTKQRGPYSIMCSNLHANKGHRDGKCMECGDPAYYEWANGDKAAILNQSDPPAQEAANMCAECGMGCHANDYLCTRCREAA